MSMGMASELSNKESFARECPTIRTRHNVLADSVVEARGTVYIMVPERCYCAPVIADGH